MIILAEILLILGSAVAICGIVYLRIQETKDKRKIRQFKFNQRSYINEKMTEFAQNIDDFKSGEEVLDTKYKIKTHIRNKTINTLEVWLSAKTDKGISSYEYFNMTDFNKRFKKITS